MIPLSIAAFLVDVAFGRARGEQRAAPHRTGASRHETLARHEPLDQRPVPQPAEHASPPAARSSRPRAGRRRRSCPNRRERRRAARRCRFFSPGSRISASTALPSGSSAALRSTWTITSTDAVCGSTSGERETSRSSRAGTSTALVWPGRRRVRPPRRAGDSSGVVGAKRHDDPERPHLHDPPEHGPGAHGLPRRHGDLGDAAGPRRPDGDRGGRVRRRRGCRRDDASARRQQPGFEAVESRAGPLELGLARRLDAQQLGRAVRRAAARPRRRPRATLHSARSSGRLRSPTRGKSRKTVPPAPTSRPMCGQGEGATEASTRRRENHLPAGCRLHLGRPSDALGERALADATPSRSRCATAAPSGTPRPPRVPQPPRRPRGLPGKRPSPPAHGRPRPPPGPRASRFGTRDRTCPRRAASARQERSPRASAVSCRKDSSAPPAPRRTIVTAPCLERSEAVEHGDVSAAGGASGRRRAGPSPRRPRSARPTR